MAHAAILLPGAVLPADLAFGDLVNELGSGVDARPKDLEVYAEDEPPSDYSLDHEIAGIERSAGDAGLDRFHLVGYSGGGAAALAFTARHPERVLTLALLEPAWTGNEGLTTEERELWREFDRIGALPADQFLAAFMRAQLRRGVELPPPPGGPEPPWMAKRPAGVAALVATFRSYDLDRSVLRSFEGPVYYALGARSNPIAYERPAERLAELFDDFTLERFEERHHFDPPHRFEVPRLAGSLRGHWERGGGTG